MKDVKYARYRIIQNKETATWRYTVQSRMLWPLPFWFDVKCCDLIDTAHYYISQQKTRSKVVHIE